MSVNPYEPPSATPIEMTPTPMQGGPVYVMDNQLVIMPGAVLPPFCVKSNEPVESWDMRPKTLTWCHPLVVVTLLISPLITLVLYLVLRKRCPLTFGLHADVHQRYWKWIYIKAAFTLAMFIAIPFASGYSDGALFVCVILSIVSLIACFVGNDALTVAQHNQGWFYIKGCSPEYLARIAAMQNAPRQQTMFGA